MYRLLATLTLLLAIPLSSASAQSLIRGRIVDAETRAPLAGVNVRVPGTTLGTTTDAAGVFVLEVDPPPARLVFSFLGYETASVDLVDGSEPRGAGRRGADGLLLVALKPGLLDLQPVIVSASRGEEVRTEAPVAVATLTPREMEEKRPNQLYEALSTLPGVHMVNLGNEQHAMSIRQPLSYKALYLYLEDGIPIRPTGIFNHNALIEVNMAGVERVEVVRGPSSSLYGAGAVGGAVNFVTPRPARTPAAFVEVRSDDHGYRRADVHASSTFGRLGVWAGGYVARQRDGWAEHSDFDKQSLSLRADYAFAPVTHLVATFTTNHLHTDTNGNLDSLNFYSQGFTSLQTFTYRRVTAHRLAVRLEHVWSSRHSTEATVYGRDNVTGQLPHYRIRNDRANPASAVGEMNEDRFRSIGFDVQHRTYFDWLQARLLAGASLDRSPNTYVAHFLDVTRDPATGRYTSYTRRDSLLTDYAVDLVNSAAYVQFELSPVDRLRLVASLRYDRIDYGYDNHLPPSAYSGAPDEKNGWGHLSPRVGFTYDLGHGRGLYANVSRGFLPPEVSELYRGVKVPVLKPSTFGSYEAGGWATFLDGRLYADASLYRMDGTNEIISVLLDDGSTENRNAGRTRHTGVEYQVRFAPARALSLRLTGANARHTFVRFEDQGQVLDGNEMDAAPGWMAGAEVVYRPAFVAGARIGLAWEHVGPYYMDPQNTLRYDGHDLVHVRLGYEVKGMSFWMNVLNATDALYANIASKSRFGQQYNPGTPRTVTFGVGYRIGEH